MAEVLVLEFSTDGALDLYLNVSGHLGIDPSTGSGDWPSGMMSHTAGLDGNDLIVVEVWESQADQEQFMSAKLGPALHAMSAPPPKRVAWFSEVGGFRQS